LSISVDNISLGSGVTIHKSSGANILPQDSHVVEQDDRMNADETGIAPYKSIKIQEGATLLDKTKGIGIVSDNRVEVTPGYYSFLVSFPSYIYMLPISQTFYCLYSYSYKIGRV